jgi:mono/diheme cytochrome c family protein
VPYWYPRFGRSFLLALVLVIAVATGTARGADDAADLYATHCAVCHDADRGGYIAPALTPTSLKRLTGKP